MCGWGGWGYWCPVWLVCVSNACLGLMEVRGGGRTKRKPVPRRIGTQTMWIATFVGSRWYAPYCFRCLSARSYLFIMWTWGTYEDEVLFQVENRHCGIYAIAFLCRWFFQREREEGERTSLGAQHATGLTHFIYSRC